MNATTVTLKPCFDHPKGHRQQKVAMRCMKRHNAREATVDAEQQAAIARAKARKSD